MLQLNCKKCRRNIMQPDRDDADERSVILEVRAGTGGDEASLFAHEIFKMYQKFAAIMGWRWEELSFSKSEIGIILTQLFHNYLIYLNRHISTIDSQNSCFCIKTAILNGY